MTKKVGYASPRLTVMSMGKTDVITASAGDDPFKTDRYDNIGIFGEEIS